MAANVTKSLENAVNKMVLSGGNEHFLQKKSYKLPTFCDACGELLMGLIRQGLHCTGCGQNYHERCVKKLSNDCSHVLFTNDLNQPLCGESQSRDPLLSSASADMDLSETNSQRCQQANHSFSSHTYKVPTVCQLCKKLLRGIVRQGMQCKDCKFNVHKSCLEKMTT